MKKQNSSRSSSKENTSRVNTKKKLKGEGDLTKVNKEKATKVKKNSKEKDKENLGVNEKEQNSMEIIAEPEKEETHLKSEEMKKREEFSQAHEKYIADSGLPLAFKLIFSEIIQKQITEEHFYSYTAMRLRQLGKEMNDLLSNS